MQLLGKFLYVGCEGTVWLVEWLEVMYLWTYLFTDHVLDPAKDQSESAILKVCKSFHVPKGKTKEIMVSIWGGGSFGLKG